MTTTALYRFYDDAGGLLYVGITHRIGERFAAHRGASSWYDLAARVALERHPTREAALKAERDAIIAERPRWNVVHNRRAAAKKTPPVNAKNTGRWIFESLASGYEKRRDLYLYPELDYSPMVDDYWDEPGADQLAAYIRGVRESYPDWWAADAVPIYWSVRAEQDGIYETAPYQQFDPAHRRRDFLTGYTWPHDEDGEFLDWYALPVRNDRFPEFARALNWLPAPLTPTCPLRSIASSRAGICPSI